MADRPSVRSDGCAPAAMVLAAGLGTRLRPLTDELPKPLVPVGDRSVLAHVVDVLAAAGVPRLVLNTHHAPSAFDPNDLAMLPLEVTVLHEPKILGTAGGISNARHALGPGDVLVWNGDTIAQIDLPRLLDIHRISGAVATLAVSAPENRPRAPASRRWSRRALGTVGIDPGGRVVRLRDERVGPEGLESHGAEFVGVQLISSRLREELPEVGCLVGDLYLPALRRGLRLQAARVVSRWVDVGTVATYLQANLAWLAERGGGSFVGQGVRMSDGITLETSVLGARATIEGAGPVERCVIWPGAHAVAPLANAVVTTEGRIVPVAGQA